MTVNTYGTYYELSEIMSSRCILNTLISGLTRCRRAGGSQAHGVRGLTAMALWMICKIHGAKKSGNKNLSKWRSALAYFLPVTGLRGYRISRRHHSTPALQRT
jgi:hypothetical protein